MALSRYLAVERNAKMESRNTEALCRQQRWGKSSPGNKKNDLWRMKIATKSWSCSKSLDTQFRTDPWSLESSVRTYACAVLFWFCVDQWSLCVYCLCCYGRLVAGNGGGMSHCLILFVDAILLIRKVQHTTDDAYLQVATHALLLSHGAEVLHYIRSRVYLYYDWI